MAQFHTKSGVYFERGGDGAVNLVVRVDDADNAPVYKSVSFSEDEWLDIVEHLHFEEIFAEPIAPSDVVPPDTGDADPPKPSKKKDSVAS